jgi:hypothetical protein
MLADWGFRQVVLHTERKSVIVSALYVTKVNRSVQGMHLTEQRFGGHMAAKQKFAYITATIVAALLAVVGAWLPWVRKQPVGITDEYIAGLDAGFSDIDLLVIILVVAVVLGYYRNWRPNGVLIGAGGLILVVFASVFQSYLAVERSVVEPGLYLLIASGFLFILIGVAAVLSRRITPIVSNRDNPRIG